MRVVVALGVFLVVASIIITRRAVGAARARRLHELGRTRSALVAERAKLVGEVGRAASLAVLEPIVQRRFGLHRPGDRQLIRLPRPENRRGN
jgi:hypothetical protein